MINMKVLTVGETTVSICLNDVFQFTANFGRYAVGDKVTVTAMTIATVVLDDNPNPLTHEELISHARIIARRGYQFIYDNIPLWLEFKLKLVEGACLHYALVNERNEVVQICLLVDNALCHITLPDDKTNLVVYIQNFVNSFKSIPF